MGVPFKGYFFKKGSIEVLLKENARLRPGKFQRCLPRSQPRSAGHLAAWRIT